MASLEFLDAGHLQPLRRALTNSLATAVAEYTFAKILNGQRTCVVNGGDCHMEDDWPLVHYIEIFPGFLGKAKAVLSDFDVPLRRNFNNAPLTEQHSNQQVQFLLSISPDHKRRPISMNVIPKDRWRLDPCEAMMDHKIGIGAKVRTCDLEAGDDVSSPNIASLSILTALKCRNRQPMKLLVSRMMKGSWSTRKADGLK